MVSPQYVCRENKTYQQNFEHRYFHEKRRTSHGNHSCVVALASNVSKQHNSSTEQYSHDLILDNNALVLMGGIKLKLLFSHPYQVIISNNSNKVCRYYP